MHGLALAVLGLGLGGDPVELPRDVEAIQTRHFLMPLAIRPERLDAVRRVRLFVSDDQGKTWRHHQNYKPSDTQVTFRAPHDGQFWFALQLRNKDGTSLPAKTTALDPAMKVYVNTQGKTLQAAKSADDLRREVEALTRTVERLRQRIKELEVGRTDQ